MGFEQRDKENDVRQFPRARHIVEIAGSDYPVTL
jgi:hypothetical protein